MGCLTLVAEPLAGSRELVWGGSRRGRTVCELLPGKSPPPKITPSVNAPLADGKVESSSNYGQEMEPCSRSANLEPLIRASALILNTGPVSREVCMSTGYDQIMDSGGATRTL